MIRPRERDAILQSIRAGVVPSVGQHHIQVGRAREIEALIADIDRIGDGGAAFRLVAGEYGAGKTFFLNLVRAVALERRLVTMHADLTADRRLHSSSGQGRALYTELAASAATRATPDGGALGSVLERFVTSAASEDEIRERLASLEELPGGYDFASVVASFYRDDALRADAVRWLRGEFTTKTDARAALGVRTIVHDENLYDQLKLLARFVRCAGYRGLLVCVDELVNLYRLANSRARNANYEQLLRVLNDCLQGVPVGLGFLFAATPEVVTDQRKGLYGYPALRSRLADNPFATGDLVDLTGPVLRLQPLTPEDLFVLLGKVRHVQASGEPSRYLVTDDEITAFMTHCATRVGDAYFRTPRSTVKAFADLLAVLEQNPDASVSSLLGGIEIERETSADDLVAFNL